ncbi:MAG: preprotein translocase subunit SecE [Calditrichaeota bacterium]|nr:MAG: preprotein translocase subunit SecE [Calditrichota bacterium]
MIDKIKEFLNQVQVEMKKVTWPEKDELINATLVVFVISAIFTLFIFFADSLMTYIINLLY